MIQLQTCTGSITVKYSAAKSVYGMQMTQIEIKPVKLVKAADGTLTKPTLGQMLEGFECNGVLFETFELAEAHREHLPLRDKLTAAMFEIVANTRWFDNDDDDLIEDMAERLSNAMLGMSERADEARDTIIEVLSRDKELYA